MLREAFQYSYINAKIRTLKSRLLLPSDYENLLGVSGYSGLAECLRVTSYGSILGQYSASYDGLIKVFYHDLFDCYRKVIRALSGNRKRLLKHICQKYELENLKTILRIIGQEKPREKVEEILLPTGNHLSVSDCGRSFSEEALLQAKSLEDILNQLKKTCYYRPLKNALYRFEEEKETFPLEMALDLSYYNQLWKIASSFSRKERMIVRSILGIQMDILNIIWIFRFKEVYHFSPEEILNYGLMQGCHISPELRKKLAYSVDRRDVVTNLAGTPYKALLVDTRDSEVSSVQLWRYLLTIVKKNWQGFPFHIGTVLDYVFFKEIEVKSLISITEAKRLNFSREKIVDYLINTYSQEVEC
jgi:V/A-type H+/Na+-transporting ATPase subunit C